MGRFNRLRRALFVFALVSPGVLAQEILKPEGLLLRGFESEALKNRRGFEAVEHGVLTTLRVDAAEQISATRSASEIDPHIDWYQARGQKYLAYSVFDYATTPYLADATDPSLYIVNVEGEVTTDLNLTHASVFEAILTSAKAYVDIGVEGIEYDVDGWAVGLGSFDDASLAAFNTWLIDTKQYSAAELQSFFGTTVDGSFDYQTFLAGKGVTSESATLAKVNQTAHFRLWRAFVNVQERSVTTSLIESVNAYAEEKLGRKLEFYFNRYGFVETPARRWNTIDLDSGSLGETWFTDVSWLYESGQTLEPVYRASLKSFDKRYESWNSPPNTSNAVQSVFLASTLASNGVATWEDEYPGTAGIASFAYRFQAQLDQTPRSEVAIFYPHASVEHNQPIQVNDDFVMGGQHYWYLGLGYLMADLNLNYDVLYGADGLVLDDTFAAPSADEYEVIFVAEARQATDKQFAALAAYVNGGGKLIVIGSDVLRFDELGRDQASSRSLGGVAYDSIFNMEKETTYGEGSIEVVSLGTLASDAYSYHAGKASVDIASIKSTVSDAMPATLKNTSLTGADRLRVLTYTDDGDGSLIVHLVNHAFNESGSEVTTQTNVELTAHLPSGLPSDAVANYADAADGSVQTLTLTYNGDGTASVTIPSVATWGILRIGSTMAAPAMPNITPMAELSFLFDYEEFSSNPDRNLVFQAADDAGLENVTFYYQKYNGSDETWGDWTAGASLSLNGVKRVDADSTDKSIPLNFADLGEGRYRAQLTATDTEGSESGLVYGLGYDTIVGFDTQAPDPSSVAVEVIAGPADGAVISEPVDVTLSISNVVDAVSGVKSIISKFSGTSFDSAAELGADYEEGYTREFTGPESSQYGTYVISARFFDYADNLSDWQELYRYVYGLPPEITEATGSHTDSNDESTAFETGAQYSVSVGDTVNFEISATNVLDDETVRWYKDDELLDGQDERTLNLGSVSSSDSGTYYAVIENAAGSAQSASFELKVDGVLSITGFSRNPSDGQVDQGGTFTLTVVAEGTGTLTYQWEAQILKNDWVVIEGATESTYTVTNATRAEHQGNYRVTVTDETGSVLSERTLRIEVAQSTGGGGGGGTSNDNDNDGVNDDLDNCPSASNEAQEDLDDDGEGDACDSDIDGDGYSNTEEGLAGTDPKDASSYPVAEDEDQDQDGIEDSLDNCPSASNEAQEDLDDDGEGDACDSDIDGDGYSNSEEASAGSNPNDATSIPVVDTDGDGIADDEDAFPLDSSESVDTDGDGIGDNADLDDDDDGVYDEQEVQDGTDPKNPYSCLEGCFSFDIDANGAAKPLTDGLLVIRHLFGFTDSALVTSATETGGSRSDAESITTYLSSAKSELDVDGDGDSKPLTDGLLVIRYLFGFRGDSLVAGAVSATATRKSAEVIEAYLEARVPKS